MSATAQALNVADDVVPSFPQQQQLAAAVSGFNRDQLHWASGYLAGLAAAQSAASPAAGFAPAIGAQTADQITVLFGSQTGNGEKVAKDLAAALSAEGYTANTKNLASYRPNQLKKERYAVFVVSTHGEGDPPDDAEDFHQFLLGDRAPKLNDLHYSVLALGDSSYEHFCATGREVDERLQALGATALVDRVDCDVDYQDAAQTWIDQLKNQFNDRLTTATPAPVPLHPVPDSPRYSADAPLVATVLANQKITGRESSKDVRHIELSIEDSGLTYLPGDSLGIITHNPPVIVEAVLNALHFDGNERVLSHRGERLLREVLTDDVEITLLSRRVLEQYAELIDSTELKALLADRQQFADYLGTHHLIDVLQQFQPTTAPSAQAFVDSLRKLMPRMYSIASSQAVYDDEVHLTVAPVRFEVDGLLHEGAASTMLSDRLADGDEIEIFVERNDRFRLPHDPDAPIILIGPGTGVAPFRAFLQQREQDGANGDNWLLFGDRNFDSDFLYQSEWLDWRRSGLLNRLDVAFSRDQKEKIYVQDRLRENATEVFAWLERGAAIYVCGDAQQMAGDVEDALLDIIASEGDKSTDDASEYIKQLRRDGRYQKDVY